MSSIDSIAGDSTNKIPRTPVSSEGQSYLENRSVYDGMIGDLPKVRVAQVSIASRVAVDDFHYRTARNLTGQDALTFIQKSYDRLVQYLDRPRWPRREPLGLSSYNDTPFEIEVSDDSEGRKRIVMRISDPDHIGTYSGTITISEQPTITGLFLDSLLRLISIKSNPKPNI